MDFIGKILQYASFGESHAEGIGGIISGYPSGIDIDIAFLESELKRRQGGSKFATPRKEPDSFSLLSGIFEGVSTGCSIGFFIKNENARSKDYSNIKDIFRPSHADFTYFQKYGIRDYRGGGRSSARESVARVLAGGLFKLLLKQFNIEIKSGIYAVGTKISKIDSIESFDFNHAKNSQIFALDKALEQEQKEEILKAKKEHNSIGASAIVIATGVMAGLGEPLGYKIDSAIASGLMGLNGVKGVEVGAGARSARMLGSQNNDFIDSKAGFLSNNSGGILGGISNGDTLVFKVHFKPTPSIFLEQKSININHEDVLVNLQGRHDPCIGVRGSVVAESIMAFYLADLLLLNASAKISNLKKIYGIKD